MTNELTPKSQPYNAQNGNIHNKRSSFSRPFGEFGFYAMPKLMDLLHVLPEYPETFASRRVLD